MKFGKLFRSVGVCGFAAAATLGVTGCTPATIHTVKKAAADISIGLAAVEQLNEDLYAAGAIDGNDSAEISQGVAEAVADNDSLIAYAKTLTTVGGPEAVQVERQIIALSDQIGSLQAQGLLHIKDPASQAKFTSALDVLRASIEVIDLALPSETLPP